MAHQYTDLFNMDDGTIYTQRPAHNSNLYDNNNEQQLTEILKLLHDVYGKVSELTTKVDRLNMEMISVRNEVTSIKAKVYGEISIEREIVLRSPFSTLEEINNLEEKLKNEEVFKKFVHEICTNGEKSYDKFIRSSWRSLFEDTLAQQFSWRGTGEKNA
ncbi:uncharacterized protein LOC118740615 [Rhagoletis pomonella]|uniref:uncharacterized protein LOC118740615 n=1 Tax=Rhagoletis pomonella TaxID=28610 RepID=UPI00177E5EA5|nr:uncharacterized protein LOC118740615 [Rhagoletis pomonella]